MHQMLSQHFLTQAPGHQIQICRGPKVQFECEPGEAQESGMGETGEGVCELLVCVATESEGQGLWYWKIVCNKIREICEFDDFVIDGDQGKARTTITCTPQIKMVQ